MRARNQSGGMSFCAVSGDYVVHFGFDADEALLAGSRGFGIQRFDITDPGHERADGWLLASRHFHDDRTGYDPARGGYATGSQPLQGFRWGDYTVRPGRRYRYRLVLLEGDPGGLTQRAEVSVEIATEAVDLGDHCVWFNRGVAGSQAYARKFKNKSPAQAGPGAFVWLSRGLEEALLDFIAAAKGPGFGLRGAFYEFTNVRVLDALADARRRGADVALVVDDRPGDPEGVKNEAAAARHDLTAAITWRKHASGIPHNKFMVLLEGGKPTAVWTGSTNISDGGIFGHSNVGHRVRHEATAKSYLDYWTQLRRDLASDAMKDQVETLSSVPKDAPAAGTQVIFSPRHGTGALKWYARRLVAASDIVMLTCPFGVTETMEEALNTPTDSLRYVLLDKPDAGVEVMKRVSTNSFAVGAKLPGRSLTGWAAEALTGFNHAVLYIHTKYMLLDPLGDDPVVITGSANWSDPSVSSNDENMLVIRGDKRVADIYLTEFMRLFDHFEFRSRINRGRPQAAKLADQPLAADPAAALVVEPDEDALKLTDAWWTEHFEPGSPRARERNAFCAGVSL